MARCYVNRGGLVRLIYRFPTDHRAQHASAKNLVRPDRSQITIQHNEVCQHAGSKRSLLFLAEFGISRTGSVCRHGLLNAELLGRKILLLAIFTLPSDRRVESTKRRYRFNWKISSKRERYSLVHEFRPCVGMLRAIASEP